MSLIFFSLDVTSMTAAVALELNHEEKYTREEWKEIIFCVIQYVVKCVIRKNKILCWMHIEQASDPDK